MNRFRKSAAAAAQWIREQFATDSLDAKVMRVQAAWAEQYGASYDAGWVCDVYDDRVVVRNPDGGFQAYAYTEAADGTLTFQAPVDVEVVYNEISEALELTGAEITSKTGNVWDVRVLKFGRSLNGFFWSREAGEKLLPFLASAPVGCFMDPAGAMGHASEKSVQAGNGPLIRNVVGDLQAPRLEADGVYASLHVHEDAGWLKQKLLGLATRGVVDKVLGLSVDTLAGYVPVQLREGAAKAITEIKRLFSVDIVTRPSADGRFIRATAGPLLTEGDQLMKREELIAMIQKRRPKLLEGRVVESLTDVEVQELVDKAMEAVAEPEPKPAVIPPKPAGDVKPQWALDMEQRDAIRESQAAVAVAVDAAQLPAVVKAKLKKQLAGRVVEAAALEAAVKEEVETIAKLSESGDVRGFGSAGRVDIAPRDKIQAGLDMLFGVTRESLEKKLADAPLSPEAVSRIMEGYTDHAAAAKDPGLRFKGLKDAYIQMTGDTEVTGHLPRRVAEAATVVLSTDWAQALGDTLYRRLLSTYAEVQYNERSIARYGSANDFRNRHVVHLGYFGDLPAVAENGLYDGLTNPTDDEVAYAVTKRGGRFAVTIETIKNDDLRVVMETVDRLGRAARRTLAQFVWTFWTTASGAGATFDIDAKAWFNSESGVGSHCNYGTTALTADSTGAAEVMALITKLGKMKEKDSAKALGLPPLGNLWLDVPLDLWSVANLLNRTPSFSTTVANPIYGMFGPNNERINANPLFTDVTDWGVHIDARSGGRESIEVSFLDGREEPELFVADLPTQGSLFTNDRIEYKIRHIYGGDLIDVVGAAKNIVAG